MLILIFVRVEIICVFQEVPYCWCTMQVDVRQTIIRAHMSWAALNCWAPHLKAMTTGGRSHWNLHPQETTWKIRYHLPYEHPGIRQNLRWSIHYVSAHRMPNPVKLWETSKTYHLFDSSYDFEDCNMICSEVHAQCLVQSIPAKYWSGSPYYKV